MRYADRARIASLQSLHDVDGAFDAAFSLVAFIMNRHLIDHMLRAGRLLTGNDFEALVIWGVLAHQNVAHLMPPGTLPSAILNEAGRLPEKARTLRPLRLRDIAAITGIPRETARRKLDWLSQQRYVERTADGWVVSTARAEPDLREFTRESIFRLLAVAEEIRVALADADAVALHKRQTATSG